MDEIGFTCVGVRAEAYAAFPTLVFRLRITESSPEGVHAIAAHETARLLILDVNGVRLVVSTVADRDASPANLAKLQAIVDSVRVERIVAAPSASPAP